LEIRAIEPRLDVPDETVGRSLRNDSDRGARDRVFRQEAPETVGPVLFVQQIAVGSEEAAAALLKCLLVANQAESVLRVGAPQKEVPVALDVGDGDARVPQPARPREKPRDGGSLELRMRDEEVEDVAE